MPKRLKKTVSYRLKFIDRARYMAGLSNLINNLAEGIYTVKCKCKYWDCFPEYTNFKNDLTEYKCLCCDKKYQQKFYEKLNERNFHTCTFSSYGNSKFILLLGKDVYRYEYMDDWKKIQWNIITWKRRLLYSLKYERYYWCRLRPGRKNWNKNIRRISSFLCSRQYGWNTCLEIYELDAAHFLYAPGLVCQAAFEKTKVKLDLLIDLDMWLMVGKAIRGGI